MAFSPQPRTNICIESLDDYKAPKCTHGPMVMYECVTTNPAKPSRYYACTALRGKGCPKLTLKNRLHWKNLRETQSSFVRNKWRMNRIKKLWRLPVRQHRFCVSCAVFLLPEDVSAHEKHKLHKNVPRKLLLQPSKLLTPVEVDKANAQYFFSNQTVDFLMEVIQRLDYRKVLCIGTPRLHEALLMIKKQYNCSSLLLDIDHRLQNFFLPRHFLMYNMFNNYFFGCENSEEIVASFLKEDLGSVLVVLDPPFGGRVELLNRTLKCLSHLWHDVNENNADSPDSLLPVLWISPYFMDKKILQFPNFTMLSYKVEYSNHDIFKNSSKKTKATCGSIVRIFTNIENKQIPLPSSEGYRFCGDCDKYVASEAQHCKKCLQCTSRDGRSYWHCDKCNRCVKMSRYHCDTCQWCLPVGHQCRPQQTGERFEGRITRRNKKIDIKKH